MSFVECNIVTFSLILNKFAGTLCNYKIKHTKIYDSKNDVLVFTLFITQFD